MNIKKRVSILALVVGVLLMSQMVSAGVLKAPEVFQTGKWTYIGETGKFEEKGSIQSICVTRDYIICLENASNDNSNNDTLVAFYKNDYDLSGNPVEQYSYAMHSSERDYEHGNGMTYNEKENKVIIASGPVLEPANLGSVYILDAETLEFERQEVVVDGGQSILGIAYLAESDQYVMMTGLNRKYKFILTDSQFKVLDTLMEGNQSEGNYFQDFCVSGDYIVALPYFVGGRKEQRIQLYSISQREWINNYPLIFAEDMSNMEPEGICEISPGHFIVGTILNNPKRMALYSLQTPVIYSIKTEIENGTISAGTTSADYGSKFKVEYTPNEDYEVKEIWVDKEQVEVRKYLNKYTFDNIDKNQSIRVVCEKVPQYHIKGTALNGTIDEETPIYANTKVVVNFAPAKNYQLKSVFVDGQLVEVPLNATNYEFEKVNEDHEIHVEFEEIPSYKVMVRVVNGYTNELERLVYQGEDYVANFKPKNNYNLKRILVNGKEIEYEDNQTTYELTQISADHVIEVVYQWRYLYWGIGIGGAVILGGGMFSASIQLKRRKQRRKYHKKAK